MVPTRNRQTSTCRILEQAHLNLPLVGDGTDVHTSTHRRGATPLLEACSYALVDVVEMLLASGASPIIATPFAGMSAGTPILEVISGAKVVGMEPKAHRAWCKHRDQVHSLLRQAMAGNSAQPTASTLVLPSENPNEVLPTPQKKAASSKKHASSKKTKKANTKGKKGLARPHRQHEGEVEGEVEGEGKEDEGEEQATPDDGSVDPPSEEAATVAGRHGTASSGCNCEKCVGGRESLHAEGTSLRPGLAEVTVMTPAEMRGGVLDFLGLQDNCACCGSPPPEGKRHPACRGCRLVRYCSEGPCQKTAWKKLGHKKSCGRPLPSMETTFLPLVKEFFEARGEPLPVSTKGNMMMDAAQGQTEAAQLREFGRASSPLALITLRLMRMRMHMIDEQMQFASFVLLEINGEATKATQDALAAHPYHLELALQGLSFLTEGILALQRLHHTPIGSGDIRIHFGMAPETVSGGIDSALAAMQVHSQQSAGEVQQVASILLATVASDVTKLKAGNPPAQLIVRAGGLRAIASDHVTKGKRHRTCPGPGCNSKHGLSQFVPEPCKQVAAMLKHKERPLLQLAGCRVLQRVVATSDDECVRAVKVEPDLIKAVQAAFKVSLC